MEEESNKELNLLLIKNIDKKIYDISYVVSIFSLICSVIMSLIFILNSSLRSVTYYLFFIISLSEVINGIGNIFDHLDFNDNSHGNFVKNLPIFLCLFSDFCPLAILCCLCFNIFDLLKNESDTLRRKNLFILGSIGASVLYSIICLVYLSLSDSYDDFYNYYFSKVPETEKKEIYLAHVHYFVMIILVGISFFFITKVILFMKEMSKQDKDNASKIMNYCKDLFDYPLFGALGWIIGFPLIFCTINENSLVEIRVFELFKLLSKFFIYLKGFLYLTLFVSSKKVSRILKRVKNRIMANLLIQDNFIRGNEGNKIIRQDETIGETVIYGR